MVHRTDLLRILYDRAVRDGVEIRTGEIISSIDDSGARLTITLQDTSRLEADLIIGADGILH